MKRYIDADEVVKESFTVQTQEYGTIDVVANDIINDQPTADVKEVIHAKWASDRCGNFYCSNCTVYSLFDDIEHEGDFPHPNKSKHCPCCGAKMDLKE